MTTPLKDIELLKKAIRYFKNRHDVINGVALAYIENDPKNTPNSMADGLRTTGFCVSASRTLMNDPYFVEVLQLLNARHWRLQSIDIKERFYGHCYNGSPNRWHTAILVNLPTENLIIDITCGQFGNDYQDKDIWTLATWANTFRSASCTHSIPEISAEPFMCWSQPIPTSGKGFDAVLRNHLLKYSHLSQRERDFLFSFYKELWGINKGLLTRTLSGEQKQYVKGFNDILNTIHMSTPQTHYAVLGFDSQKVADNWLKIVIEKVEEFPQYLLLSKDVNSSCAVSGIRPASLFLRESLSALPREFYVVVVVENVSVCDFDFVPNISGMLYYGQNLKVKSIKKPKNSGEVRNNTVVVTLINE